MALAGWVGLGFLGLWVGLRINRSAAEQQLEKLQAQWSTRVQEAHDRVSENAGSTDLLQRELAAERRKSAGYFETIESVLKQRAVWEDLYNKQAVSHGNAQALMMDAIGYLSGRLQKEGIDVQIPSLLKEVQELYQTEHVFPVTERLRAPTGEPIENGSGRVREGFGKGSIGALDAAAAQAVGVQTMISGETEASALALQAAIELGGGNYVQPPVATPKEEAL